MTNPKARVMDDDEREISDRTDAIEAAMTSTGIDFEIFYDEDGGEGYHITVMSGDEHYRAEGGMQREYTLAYWTRDDTWYWDVLSEAGRRSGPWPCRDLEGNADADEIARYIVDYFATPAPLEGGESR